MDVWGALWNLITPRWILISVWWDTKHQSQSTNALAANHFNEYILFWPLSGLFFVFRVTFLSPHYSLSALGLFYIHTVPFNLFSYPISQCSLASLFHKLTFPLYFSPPMILPSPSLVSITSTVKTSIFSSKLELGCLYSERSQVQSANWKYQNKSHQLHMLSNGPGSITTILPRPITSDTAGNYTCTLRLKNGQTIWATQAVTLPSEGGRDCIASWILVGFLILIFFVTSAL